MGHECIGFINDTRDVSTGRTGMRRNDDNPIDDKWERETEKLAYRPRIQDEGSEHQGND